MRIFMLENPGSLNIFVVLSIGLIFGLKHATEVDHVVAISTIVSRHRNVFRSAVVGGLWGLGHTVSLLVIGAIVLSLRIAIPEIVSKWLEFAVALMIIGLGASALWRASRKSSEVHDSASDTTSMITAACRTRTSTFTKRKTGISRLHTVSTHTWFRVWDGSRF